MKTSAFFSIWFALVLGVGALLFVKDPLLAFFLKIEHSDGDFIGRASTKGEVERQFFGEFLFESVTSSVPVFNRDRFATSENGSMQVLFEDGVEVHIGSQTWWTVVHEPSGRMLKLERGELEVHMNTSREELKLELPGGEELLVEPQSVVRLNGAHVEVVEGKVQKEGKLISQSHLVAKSPFAQVFDLKVDSIPFEWISGKGTTVLEIASDPKFKNKIHSEEIKNRQSWTWEPKRALLGVERLWWRIRDEKGNEAYASFYIKKREPPRLLSPVSGQSLPYDPDGRLRLVWEGSPDEVYRVFVEEEKGIANESHVRGLFEQRVLPVPGHYRWWIEGDFRSEVRTFEVVRDEILPPPREVYQPKVQTKESP